ncbi:MAG: hypothetical protein D6683_05840 [Actinomyces sp.]|nr:MAG: hypothetical protein D6683_05840 [Actinomyces sp.]
MNRLRNTLDLARTSWEVLRRDRELLWLPVLSFVVSLAVLAAYLVPLMAITGVGGENSAAGAAVWLLGLGAALSVGIVSVFFNGALVAGAHERLTGGDPTVSSAVRRAWSRLPGLVPWALITTTVGLMLRAARERSGTLANLAVSVIGAAWDVVTFLVVPAIVVDGVGAVPGLRRSAELLSRTWGENIAARVGFGLLGFLAVLPGLALAALGVATGSAVVAVVAVVVAVVWIALVVVVMTALTAVFQTALYHYATTGAVPAGFENTSLPRAFGPR